MLDDEIRSIIIKSASVLGSRYSYALTQYLRGKRSLSPILGMEGYALKEIEKLIEESDEGERLTSKYKYVREYDVK